MVLSDGTCVCCLVDCKQNVLILQVKRVVDDGALQLPPPQISLLMQCENQVGLFPSNVLKKTNL